MLRSLRFPFAVYLQHKQVWSKVKSRNSLISSCDSTFLINEAIKIAKGVFVHLCEKRLIDLHPGVGALRQHVPASPPGVVNGRVGVRHTAKKHRPLEVELLLRLPDALMDRYQRVVQVWGRGDVKRRSWEVRLIFIYSWNISLPILLLIGWKQIEGTNQTWFYKWVWLWSSRLQRN